MKRVKHTVLSNIILSLCVTLVVLGVMVFAGSSSARAVTVSFPSLPSSKNINNPYTFTVKIDIENTDLLPVRSIDL